ncbi:MAG: hypothetical protein GWN00_38120, partial [Aliifodinibius sp.]|nr:hypothetical protein [Fodinibius sp.]NIV14327.1 hypothetical protein [Fodinibius sp.]NIY30394.1 hypothetical protein [Fodinibius sp.]
WDITVLSNFSSGKPYTPGTTDPVEVQTLENTATGPPNYNTDIKIKKYFNMSNIKFSLYLDIFNLFNQKNAQIEYGFNPWTGNPH